MMERKKYLIVTAGGSGTRMGASVPKQFLRIGRKTVLQWTMEKFISAVPDIKIITVLPESHFETWKHICYNDNFIYPQNLVKGGITRFHSVRNGLAKVPDNAIAAVHDGVRPLVSETLITKLFSMAETHQAVVPVIPCIDTIKKILRKENLDGESVFEGMPGETADRNILFGAQTPQIFHSEVLKAAYRQAFSPEFTDDASVAENNGCKITYIEGERYNLKITTPEDLKIAGLLLGR